MFKTLYNEYNALDPAGPGDAIFDRITKIARDILAQEWQSSTPWTAQVAQFNRVLVTLLGWSLRQLTHLTLVSDASHCSPPSTK